MLLDVSNLLLALTRWANDKTFTQLCNLITKNFKVNIQTEDLQRPRHTIFKLFVFPHLQNAQNTQTIRVFMSCFIYAILTIIKNSNLINFSEDMQIDKNIVKIAELLIELISKYEKIFYWEFTENNAVILREFTSNVFNKLDYGPNTRENRYDVIQNQESISILIGNKNIPLENIQKIKKEAKQKDFVKIYKAFANALIKAEEFYCPWCYPKEGVPHSKREGRCDDCKIIMEFFVPKDKYDKLTLRKMQNRFNMSVKNKKVKNNIDETIRKRGQFLLAELDKSKKTFSDLNNEEMLSEFEKKYKRVEEIIKKRYSI